jgi:hypothetical protein
MLKKMLLFCVCLLGFSALAEARILHEQTGEMDIEIVAKEDFFMSFDDGERLINKQVLPSLENDSLTGRHPAVVEISGLPVEAMIDIYQLETLQGNGANTIAVTDFDIIRNGAGASVIVRPGINDYSYLVPIGGKVTTNGAPPGLYKAVNIITINYP